MQTPEPIPCSKGGTCVWEVDSLFDRLVCWRCGGVAPPGVVETIDVSDLL